MKHQSGFCNLFRHEDMKFMPSQFRFIHTLASILKPTNMPYDEFLTDRIRKAIRDQHATFEEKI